MRKTVTIAVIIVAALCAFTTRAADKPTVEALKKDLASVVTPADSVRLLYDIFDIQSRCDQGETCEMIYHTAMRAGDQTSALDALRHLANMYSNNDSLQEIFEKRAHEMPGDSDDKKETEVFTYLARINMLSSLNDEEQVRQKLNKLLKKYTSSEHKDLYQHIETLFTICILLGHSTKGELLNDYLDRLGDLIDQLPNPLSPLRSKYLVEKAIISTINGNHASAIQADKKLLETVRRLEINYHKQGRHHREYARSYYSIYRRMLSNHAALTPQEIEKIYREIQKLAEQSPEVAADYARNPRPDIYYYMATRRYSEAIPLLQKAASNPVNKLVKMSLLRDLKTAATQTGDSVTLLRTLIEYNDCLEDYIHKKSVERMRELQILYNVNDLKLENSKLETGMRERDILSHKRFIFYSMLAFLGLLGFVIILMRQNRRIRRMIKDATASNNALLAERERLKLTQEDLIKARDRAHDADHKKTEFINNMSHEVKEPINAIVGYSQLIVDSVDDERRQYLERYSNIITLNAELLLKLVNDVLDSSALENGAMKVDPKIITMQSVASISAASIANSIKPDVKFIMKPPEEDEINFRSDPQRVEQVLLNLLSNAAKFTYHGTIELSWGIDKDNNKVWFAVTDTGPGIPEGKEELIFRRFEKLGSYTQGTGLGLHICRLVARVLGGEVKLDTSYDDGSRFVFTLPRNM